MLFAEIQPFMCCFLCRQIREEVADQGLFSFVASKIILSAFDHQLQTCQWVA